MSDLTHAARPYARAIFELADETKSVDSWTDMLAFLSAVIQDDAMVEALDSPKLTDQQKADLVAGVAEGHVNAQGKNLIEVLSENDRLKIIPAVFALFEEYRDEAAGIVEAEVISAQPLSPEDENKLSAALNKKLGREVKIVSKVDESLLGGAIIRAGDLVIDGSIQGRLGKLASSLGR
jgi:F-type H+-transporting ATPase subunit delta